MNAPLHEGTRGLVNAELLKHFKHGAWLVNTARGAICDADDVAAALKSGQLSGYAGKYNFAVLAIQMLTSAPVIR